MSSIIELKYLTLYRKADPNDLDPSNLPVCIDLSIGGIADVWVSRRSWQGRKWFYEETSKRQYGRVTGNVKVGAWHRLITRQEGSTFTQVQEDGGARSYAQTLSLTMNAMSLDKRDLIEEFVTCRDVCFVIRDLNNRYWLLGETAGMRTSWESGTDDFRGVNTERITFTCRERYPVRELSSDFVTDYLTDTRFRLCGHTWSELGCPGGTWSSICGIPY